MKIRLDVQVQDVVERHAVVEVPDQVGYRVCRNGRATQMPPFKPVTTTLTQPQIDRLDQWP
jgi:hypothetical protein